MIFGIAATGFAWDLTDRLADDTLAMLMGAGLAGLIAILVMFVVMRLMLSDRASERKHSRKATARTQPAAPVIVIAGPPQPHKVEGRRRNRRSLPAQPPAYDDAGYAYPTPNQVEEIYRRMNQIPARQWAEIEAEGNWR